MISQITEAVRIAHEQKHFFEFHLRNIFSGLWEIVYTRMLEQKQSQISYDFQEDERIKQMLAFLQENYAQKLTVRQIADCIPISERECYRIFQDRLNMTPMDFLTSLRLNKSMELLTDAQKSIVEIALETGFCNSAISENCFVRIITCHRESTEGDFYYENKYLEHHSFFDDHLPAEIGRDALKIDLYKIFVKYL